MAVLAVRVCDAHAARVWVPLGCASWGAYCAAEFGISRAQAYRLLDVDRALAVIHGAVTAGTGESRTRDTGPEAAAVLDYGLSQRALFAVSARGGDGAELITRRLTALGHDVRRLLVSPPCGQWSARLSATSAPTPPPPPSPAGESADLVITELRRVADSLYANTYAIGELMLEVAPAYLSDTAAADVPRPAVRGDWRTPRPRPGRPPLRDIR
ncbi:hypothetical protein ACH40D_20660 [Streptomyces olivaceoviridis]|uniref:Uncharacterized protein n=1 Tax=Streptomyces olivaceoviridis TaxID=1921 RepID=A0ABW7VP99_STROI|nr:hypothetical protein [Streptomyces corchorusii]